MDILLEPFRFGFFRHGIVVATLAGALCGLVGVYVVLRGMSYIGHGLSHAILGGTVVGYVTNFNFYVTGGIWGAMSALMITGLSRTRKIGATRHRDDVAGAQLPLARAEDLVKAAARNARVREPAFVVPPGARFADQHAAILNVRPQRRHERSGQHRAP